jgi:hypothetical protein
MKTLVNELKFQRSIVYLCEFCGYGYQTIGTAERCEQHCDTQLRSSAKIRVKAVYHPAVEVITAAAGRQLQHRHTSKI